MKLTHTITLKNGFPIVLLPPTLAEHTIVRAYHEALLKEVQSLDYFYSVGTEPQLFEAFRPFYEAVCSRLNPSVDPALIPSHERHRLLICGDITPHPDDSGQVVLQPSALEELMGYRIPTKADKPGVSIVSSGHSEIDLLGDLMLILDAPTALQLSNRYGMAFLSALAKQVNDRRGYNRQLEEGFTPEQIEQCAKIEADFEANPESYLAGLAELGVAVPDWVINGGN